MKTTEQEVLQVFQQTYPGNTSANLLDEWLEVALTTDNQPYDSPHMPARNCCSFSIC